MTLRNCRTWAVFLIVAGGMAAAPAPSSLPLIPDVTEALFQFDEGSGITTADASGNGHTGTLEGLVTPFWTQGRSGNALDLSGDDSRVHLSPEVPVGSAWTIQVWTRFPLDTNGSGWNYLASNNGSQVHVLVRDGVLGVFTMEGGWAPYYSTSTIDINMIEGWHLLSAVGSGGQTTFYLDAELLGSAQAQVTLPVVDIGGNSPWGWSWGGAIDSLRILDVARSAEEIAIDAYGIPVPPDAPGNPGQARLDGTPLLPGGETTGGFVVKAEVTGAAAFHYLEVEVKPVGVAFDGSSGLFTSVDEPDGSEARVSVMGLDAGAYHWRLRTVDPEGASPWVAFGADPDAPDEADVVVVAVAAVGGASRGSGCGGASGGTGPAIPGIGALLLAAAVLAGRPDVAAGR